MTTLHGASERAQRPDEVRWGPAAVLIAVVFVDRIETSVTAGVLPALQAEWGFSDTAGGAIPAAAAIAGILASLPAGYLADRVRRTLLIAVVVAVWSIVTLGSALAIGFGMFFVTRIALGFADSLDNPAASSLLADYYPPARRATVFGLHRLGYFAGPGIGILLGGVFAGWLGWRSAFLVMVIPGLVVAWLCWRLPEPERGAADGLTASADRRVGRGMSAFISQLRRVGRITTARRLFTGLTILFLGLIGAFFWLPTYFQRTQGLSSGVAAALTALIVITGTTGGTLLGGVLGDRLHRRVTGARVLIGGLGQLFGVAAFIVAIGLTRTGLQVTILVGAVLVMALAVPTLTAAIADVLPPLDRGAGFALLQLLVILGGAFGPLLTGVLSDRLDALGPAIQLSAAPMLVAALIVLRARKSVDDDTAAALS